MQKTVSSKLWTLDFALLCGAALLLYSGNMMLSPAVPLFVTEKLGLTSAEVGLVSSLFTIVALASRPLAGYAIDRWNRRTVLVLSAILLSLTAWSHTLPSSFGVLVVLRMLHGLPFAGVTTALSTVAADLVPVAQRGEGISVFGFTQAMAQAAGPSFALGALDNSDYQRVFLLAGLATAVGTLLVLGVRYRPLPRRTIATLSLRTLFSFAGILYMIMLYADQYQVAHRSWWYIVGPAGTLLARAIAGRVFDRQGPRAAVTVGMGTMFLAYATLAAFPSELGFLVAALFKGLGTGVMQPCTFAMAANMVESERRGAAMATVFAAMDLGVSIGASVLGRFAAATGSHAMMYGLAAAWMSVPVALYTFKVLPDYACKCASLETAVDPA